MIISKSVSENSYNEINMASSSSDYNNKILDNYFKSKPDSVLNNTESRSEDKVINSITRDPLTMIDIMLTGYINSRMSKADTIAAEISEKSKAVAEINRLWGQLMKENLKNVDPTNIDKKTDIYITSIDEYKAMDKIIKDIFKEPKGMRIITATHVHNYDQLQASGATMTAYSDSIQVDLDSSQQEFKNLMTAITSAQEEIRDLRRIVISFTER